MKAKLSKSTVIGAAVWCYQQVTKRGIFTLLRYSPNPTGTKFQSHVDWDNPGYSDLVDKAKEIKHSNDPKEQ